MTETLTAPADYRTMGDDDLAVMLTDAEGEAFGAIVAELDRRDRAARMAAARAGQRVILAEGYDAAHAQYVQASEWTRGKLLSDLGRRRVTDEMSLWTGSEETAMRYASEELRDFWLWVQPRISPGAYARQRGVQRRIDERDARDQASEGDDHEHDDDRTGRARLAEPDASALRHGVAAEAAPQAGGRGTVRGGGPAPAGAQDSREAGASARGARGPVRGRGNVTVTADPRVEAYFTRARGAVSADAIPVRAPSEVAVPAAGTVAVREPGQIPGDKLLDLIRDKWFGRYARFPSAAALDAVTLWLAHAHMRDREGVLVFRATPRLYLLSNDPGSGKGRVLELIGMTAPNCYGLDLEPSKSGLMHSLNKERATVLIDEADILFGAGGRKADVRSVINGGTYRHGTVLDGKGAKANRTPVFGVIAVAGLDVMEKATGDALKALLSRGVKIRMVKAAGDDKPAKINRAAEAEAAQAKQWLAAWAAQVRDEVAAAEPDMPADMDGRQEDIWGPLIAVADAAGGSWPERARSACEQLAMAVPVPEADEEDETIEDQFAAFAAGFGTDDGE